MGDPQEREGINDPLTRTDEEAPQVPFGTKPEPSNE